MTVLRSAAAEPALEFPADSSTWGTGITSQRSNMAAVLHGVRDLRFEQAPPMPDRRDELQCCWQRSVAWLCGTAMALPRSSKHDALTRPKCFASGIVHIRVTAHGAGVV